MPLFLSPVCNDQTFDANGDPLNGGQIETYIAGSSTPAATYTDDTGGTPQSNPIILNSLGYPALGPIWLTGGQSYKFIIKDSLGVTLRTIDNISGVNDASVSQSEWVVSGLVPTYIDATSFSVPGDRTQIFQIGRRVRTTNTSGLVTSTISNSVFAAGITTVTLTNDSTTLDAGLTTVEYALLSASPLSVPDLPFTKITGVASIAQGGTGATTAAGARTALGLDELVVQAGTVSAFARNSAPAGWLKANGAAVSRSSYSALFAAIGTTFGAGDGSTTFNLPDLRGEFVRGWDDGRGVDTSRVFGSAQLDAAQNFTASISFNESGPTAASGIAALGGITTNYDGGGGFSGSRSFTLDASRQIRTASETRPRNIALLFCIKY